MLATNSAFAAKGVPATAYATPAVIREVSFLISATIDCSRIDRTENPRLGFYVDMLLAHLQQMCVQRNESYYQPFMLGLAAEALTRYDAYRQQQGKSPDPRVLYYLQAAARLLTEKIWVPDWKSWAYQSHPEGHPEQAPATYMTGAPDLNLLVVPLFWWLFQRTGLVAYLEFADAGFIGGTLGWGGHPGAWVDQGKQFVQNARWIWGYLQERRKHS
jgi:hypothetical protein